MRCRFERSELRRSRHGRRSGHRRVWIPGAVAQVQITAGQVKIHSLPDLDRIANSVLAFDGVEHDWLYAPPRRVRDLMSDNVQERPYASRVFGLPKTHVIEHVEATAEDHLDFHLWVLSFFVGMRLTSMEAGFLDATPIRPSKLVDFILLGSSFTRAVELAEDFWKTNPADGRRAKHFMAAVHALFLSQNPLNLEFERFMYLYIAIDACYALTKSLCEPSCRLNQTERIKWMCSQFSLTKPEWADSSNEQQAEVVRIRNDTLHEGLFMNAPLGFAVHEGSTNQNLTLEMQALVCRLLVALIGSDIADYIQSPVNTRQMHGLELR